MPTVVLHISDSAEAGRRPSICLEDFDPRAGTLTRVDDTLEEVPGRLLERCDHLLNELSQEGGKARARAHIGVELYAYIAQTGAGREWFRRCKASGMRKRDGKWDEPLRTYLQIEPESLQRLPWELITESANANPFAPFRLQNHLAARGHPLDQSEQESMVRSKLPLSILVAIYNIEMDFDEGDERFFRSSPQAEVDAIFTALRGQPGIWQIEVLRNPRERQLREALEATRPQILHFIGEPSGPDDPQFTAKISGNETESFRISGLQRILSDMDDPPRLFLLNGCRTTEMAPSEAFRALGSKAVITNQAIVYGPPAITFTRVFYEKLAETGDAALAVREARSELWKIQSDDKYDWGIPVLTLHDGPETIIPDKLPDIAKSAKAMIQAGGFGEPGWHVDRLRQSRQVWSRVGSNRQIALINGRRETGKSLLLRTCMLTWKLRSHPAVLFDGWDRTGYKRGRANIKTVLQYIGEELQVEFAGMPSTRDKLTEFLAELDNSAGFAGNGDADDVHPYERPCRQFISILREATAGRPLMLAFDELKHFYQDDLQRWLKDYIFRPIARGLAGHTYIVIATEDKSLLGWREPDWDGWTESVRLERFEHAEAILMAHEYGARRGYLGDVHIVNGNERMAKWIEEISKSPDFQGAWLPVELRELANDFDGQ